MTRSVARKQSPVFPSKPVANPVRREERIHEQISEAPDREYEIRDRSVRITSDAIDPVTWLRNQYTNDENQMICQICKEEMPFRKRDGTHYFEKTEILSREFFPKEHEAQYLALCPICAAKYKEFIKTDEQEMSGIMDTITTATTQEIPVSLGNERTSIRFVETHLHDLKTIIRSVK